ncbi:fungal-specific transcription factor domain-containing protein [Aspergillus pseudotamarii]|uniref:Fungal-specific transcription factor domain-containing protein n=1 Tax=Aspergillus pseudotamarii TaxID=132259 RepID=A0A5N6SYE9_ASPPS|nr:fungal-specific transcription factor domain-containing protein [Aspergillus pseudotamarii]KAE8138780.1 fungal-specific transcription factor domain-containing protein [Aspergillus pseudotamarii]
MPNAAAPAVSAQQTPPITRAFGDQDRDQSADESWSAVDSDNDLVTQNGSASRSLKRKRPLTVSCELCKQRKVKCDRAQPSCGWCARNGQLCEYKERKKPGLRAGYGKELEQRLDRLEEVIQTQARLIENHILQSQPRLNHEFPHPGPHSYSSPSEPSAAHGPSPRNAAYFHEPASAPAHPRPSDASITSPSDISVRNVMQSHLTSGLNPPIPIPQVSDTTHPNDYTGNESSLKVPVNLFSNQEQSFADPELDLPPYDLLYALVDLYFDHINSWCPILHRRTTLDTFFGPSPLEEADRMVLYAIVATTLRFSSDSRLNEQNRKRYHDSSKQKVLLYGLENSSVKALQALVILALDLVGSSNGPPGWKLLALITRSVVQLGLAVESKSSLIAPVYPSIYTLRAVTLPDSESWVEDEGRRRLFWMVYFLDRYSTLATAFDFALDDKDIDRKLPCKDEFFMKNQPVETRWFHHSGDRADYLKRAENVGSFGLYVEILGIMSRIHTFLKRPVDIGALSDVEEWQATYRKLDGELTAWEFGLPAEYAYENSSRLFNGLKSNKGLPCDWVQLHATYQTAVIRLHSSAAYPTTRSPIFTPSYSASQRCLFAVENILSVTRFVVDNNMLDKLGPPFAFTLWVSARLLLVHGSTIAHTVSPDIIFFVDTLAQMGKYWKVAERYSTILQRVLDEYGEYQQSGVEDSERLTPSSVKILADMRRCAFDLDFLISRQPRSSPAGSQPTVQTPGAHPRNLAPNELEYLDVFGFFNVPRVPAARAPDITGLDINETVNNPMSINGLTGSVVDGAAPNANEFNITNYLIPTPETDWLFRSEG